MTREEEKAAVMEFVRERYWHWFHHQMKNAVDNVFEGHYNVHIGMDVSGIVPTSYILSDMREKYGDRYLDRIKNNLWHEAFFVHHILADASGGDINSKKVRRELKAQLNKYGFTMKWRRSGVWQGWELHELRKEEDPEPAARAHSDHRTPTKTPEK